MFLKQESACVKDAQKKAWVERFHTACAYDGKCIGVDLTTMKQRVSDTRRELISVINLHLEVEALRAANRPLPVEDPTLLRSVPVLKRAVSEMLAMSDEAEVKARDIELKQWLECGRALMSSVVKSVADIKTSVTATKRARQRGDEQAQQKKVAPQKKGNTTESNINIQFYIESQRTHKDKHQHKHDTNNNQNNDKREILRSVCTHVQNTGKRIGS